MSRERLMADQNLRSLYDDFAFLVQWCDTEWLRSHTASTPGLRMAAQQEARRLMKEARRVHRAIGQKQEQQ